jgi:hypothetical protein
MGGRFPIKEKIEKIEVWLAAIAYLFMHLVSTWNDCKYYM